MRKNSRLQLSVQCSTMSLCSNKGRNFFDFVHHFVVWEASLKVWWLLKFRFYFDGYRQKRGPPYDWELLQESIKVEQFWPRINVLIQAVDLCAEEFVNDLIWSSHSQQQSLRGLRMAQLDIYVECVFQRIYERNEDQSLLGKKFWDAPVSSRIATIGYGKTLIFQASSPNN